MPTDSRSNENIFQGVGGSGGLRSEYLSLKKGNKGMLFSHFLRKTVYITLSDMSNVSADNLP